MTRLCGVWWCSNTISMANTFPKLKKSSSWVISSVSKEDIIYPCIHWHRITQNKFDSAITKRMNFNCPIVETSESTEPSDNYLVLNAIAYIFSKIFQPELKQFLQRLWTPCLHLWFPLRGEQGNWKKRTLSLLWNISLCCGGIWEHKNP